MIKMLFRISLSVILVLSLIFNSCDIKVERSKPFIAKSNKKIKSKTIDSENGIIRIDSTYPHTFIFSNGKRFFPMGETCYYLLSVSDSVIHAYIDSRSKANFNFIRVGALGSKYWPFGGNENDPDYSVIKEDELFKIDDLFNYTASKSINIELILWMYGKDGGIELWGNNDWENFWVETIVNRYKDRSNLFMWTVANEFERYPDNRYRFDSSDVLWAEKIISKIKSIDSIHLVGVHPSVWVSNAPPHQNFNSFNGHYQKRPQTVWQLWEKSQSDIYITQNNEGVQ
jgi:hypothetical protein